MPVITRSQDPAENVTPETDRHEEAMSKQKEPTLAELLAEMREGNLETQAKLTSIETSIATNQKVVEDYIKQNDEIVQGLQGKVDRLKATVNTSEGTVYNLSDEIEKLKRNAHTQKKITEQLQRAGKQAEEERRRPNVILEGVPEDKNIHPRKQVSDLLSEIGVKPSPECIVTASRLGAVPKGKSRRPRYILVKFSTPFWKQEIFRNINKAKDNEKWCGVHVQDDLPPEILEHRRDLRCLAALAKEKGHRVTIRGGVIVVDDISYSYSDIDTLPNGINMENAKLVKIDEGWAFQSHHAFPSSMYPCNIRHKDQDFHCVEQA